MKKPSFINGPNGELTLASEATQTIAESVLLGYSAPDPSPTGDQLTTPTAAAMRAAEKIYYSSSMHEIAAIIDAETGLSELIAALRTMLASAYPHPVEHPTMTAAWATGRAALARYEGQ